MLSDDAMRQVAAQEVVSTRLFPVPRARLFEAFSRPTELADWWGPEGFTNVIHAFDLRPGGRWRFDMRGPDGSVHPQEKTFLEVVRPERIVLQHTQVGHTFQLTVTFEEEAEGTRLTWRMRFASAAELAPVKQRVIKANEENLARLERHLARPLGAPANTASTPTLSGEAFAHSTRDGFTVERVFNAPRERVFRAWTDPEILKRWWACEGALTPSCTVDLRIGGRFHFCMRMADGQEVWGRGVYTDIVAPERLAYIDSFSDEHGNLVPPSKYGMSATHPVEALVTVTFTEDGNRTKVTIRHALPQGVAERESPAQGWGEMLDRLGEVLA